MWEKQRSVIYGTVINLVLFTILYCGIKNALLTEESGKIRLMFSFISHALLRANLVPSVCVSYHACIQYTIGWTATNVISSPIKINNGHSLHNTWPWAVRPSNSSVARLWSTPYCAALIQPPYPMLSVCFGLQLDWVGFLQLRAP